MSFYGQSDKAVLRHLGQRLRQARLRRNLSQQELADRVGVTRQTILSIERGRYNPSVGLALRLAETFGVTVEALFEIDRRETQIGRAHV